MRTGIIVAGLFSFGLAAAQEPSAPARPQPERIDLESAAGLIATIASCAALHAAAADLLERENLSEHATTARRRAEIDQLTAMYLLAEDRVANGGSREPLTAFTSSVEQLTAAAAERMNAIVTGADAARIKREEDFCASFIPLEDEILGKIDAD
jgi:hypothetical protein